MKTRKLVTIEVRSEDGKLKCPVMISFDAIGDRQKEVCRRLLEAVHATSGTLGHDVLGLLKDDERANWLNALGGRGMAELVAEIQHGRQKWGGENPDAHDDAHGSSDWERFIRDKTEQATHATPMEWRARMLQVASLAMSAVRSFDRQEATTKKAATSTGMPPGPHAGGGRVVDGCVGHVGGDVEVV